MADLKSPKWIWIKGWLFLLMGCAAAALVLLESPSLRNALYLSVAIWAFCRFYYFAFYVIQNYIDPGYRFSGLASFLRYILRKRTARE
jgi:hypothetical protein